ncbi:hypothetical protein PFISCL1PPCAC_16125, partial [Pristionchus fissidentatus]
YSSRKHSCSLAQTRRSFSTKSAFWKSRMNWTAIDPFIFLNICSQNQIRSRIEKFIHCLRTSSNRLSSYESHLAKLGWGSFPFLWFNFSTSFILSVSADAFFLGTRTIGRLPSVSLLP